MDKPDFSNIGDDIKNIVQDAVNTRDFHQLNQDIGNTVNRAIDEVRRSIGLNHRNNQQWNREPGPRPGQYNTNTTYNQPQKQPTNVTRASAYQIPVGRVSGILLSVFGNIGIGLLGIAIIVLSVVGHVTNSDELFGTIVLGLIPVLVVSILAAAKGNRIRKRLKRFQLYINMFRGRNYCLIKELSSNSGLSNKFIVKDLRKMISIGMFPEGHIDDQKTCFMLNQESYGQYLKLQENMRMQHQNEQTKREESKKEEQNFRANAVSQETRKAIDEGRLFIRKIKEANDAIPGEEVSRKLDRLEDVTGKIFDYVELHPEQLSDIQKFMEYYLPTTLKLLNAYKEFDYQSVQGENITTAKKEIEKTLDTINLAFENLLDSLFEDAAMDISTDISVLETMLAQEGLTEKNFNVN